MRLIQTVNDALVLQRAESRGGDALGTGNSVPEYVPQENYLTMIEAAVGPVFS